MQPLGCLPSIDRPNPDRSSHPDCTADPREKLHRLPTMVLACTLPRPAARCASFRQQGARCRRAGGSRRRCRAGLARSATANPPAPPPPPPAAAATAPRRLRIAAAAEDNGAGAAQVRPPAAAAASAAGSLCAAAEVWGWAPPPLRPVHRPPPAAAQPLPQTEPLKYDHILLAILDSNPVLSTASRTALVTAATLATQNASKL